MTTLNADFLFPDDTRNDPRMKGFAEALGSMFNDLGPTLDKLKIWDIDNLGEDQLDAFSREINLRSYSECADITEKRAFCKIGGELQRYSGSPWSVKTALEVFGFTNILLWENEAVLDATYNGLYKYNAWVKYSSQILFSGNFFSVSADNMTGNEEKAARIVKSYKPAHAYLRSVFNN